MDKANEDQARVRWLAINAARIGGVIMVVVGILALRGSFEFPDLAAWVLLVVGLLDIFLVPLILARRWRTPAG